MRRPPWRSLAPLLLLAPLLSGGCGESAVDDTSAGATLPSPDEVLAAGPDPCSLTEPDRIAEIMGVEVTAEAKTTEDETGTQRVAFCLFMDADIGPGKESSAWVTTLTVYAVEFDVAEFLAGNELYRDVAATTISGQPAWIGRVEGGVGSDGPNTLVVDLDGDRSSFSVYVNAPRTTSDEELRSLGAEILAAWPE